MPFSEPGTSIVGREGRPSLRLSEVKELAAQEYCQPLHFKSPGSTGSLGRACASFEKYDAPSDSHALIQVWYDAALVGVSVAHPRQGTTQRFFQGVDGARLRQILRAPRASAGYPEPKRRGGPGPAAELGVGDRVQVEGFGEHGHARVTGTADAAGKMKVRRADIVSRAPS